MSAKKILDMIKQRQGNLELETDEQKERKLYELSMRRAPLSADDFQIFKKNFVEEYGGEKVQDTGMTHSEFLQYMKDGTREGESIENNALRRFLYNLDK
jgi:hypothetical protein